MSVRRAISVRRYLAQRILHTILVWFLIATLNFFLFRIMPGDPRAALLKPGMNPDLIHSLTVRFGLDQPLAVQFILYIVNIFRLDFGSSFTTPSQTVLTTIFGEPGGISPFWNTVILMGASILISVIIGIVFGVVAAARRDSKVDVGSTTFFLVTYAMPVFWIGLLILLVFGFYLDVIPLFGTITPGVVHSNFLELAGDYLWHMAGPCFVLTLSFVGGFYLVMRDSVLDVFTQDFILAAKAKGLKERTILFGHAMRNALLPMVSTIAVNMPYVISGATITETVFTWQGLGLLTYFSILSHDYPVLQAIFLMLTTVAVISNLIADILYLYLDPRIRY